ncbi:PKD domain-containing protein [Pseudoflavitalea rhizosphaerae]|uniref:PKD domain-containing protein n=1 Tax=Pseudoflavitalea rhizosphaerae TaxID=1884793 RepID=UPI000F8D5D58|nr:PKD domain-containing protein [Pseudoflavitalea rhizosphaerae]
MNNCKFDIKNFLLAAALILGVSACSKDSDPAPDVVFEIDVDAYTVAFTNKTADVKSFKWEFGDGATSTEENPTHTYAGKGKYVPTLYVTMQNGATYEASTVLRISKSSAVKMDDNTLSDWDTVAVNVVNSGAAGGIFRKAKYDYDGNYIYFYFEIATTKAAGDIWDFYMDTDNNNGTGLITWLFGGAGNDVLLEGVPLVDWFDVFYHKGAQNSFTFDPQSISEFYRLGFVQEVGGLLKVEGRLARSKIKGLTGKGMKIGVVLTKSDWSATVGTSPDTGAPSFFLDMSE